MAEEFFFPQEKMSFVRCGFKAFFAKELMVFMDSHERFYFFYALGLDFHPGKL